MKVKSRIYSNQILKFNVGIIKFQNGNAEISEELWKEICDRNFPGIFKEGDEPEYKTRLEEKLRGEIQEGNKEFEAEINRLKGIIETQKQTIAQKDKEIENWKAVVEELKSNSNAGASKEDDVVKENPSTEVDDELLKDLKSMKKDELIEVAKSEDGGSYSDEDLNGKTKEDIINMILSKDKE